MLQLDVLADQPADHALHRAHGRAELERLRLEHLAATEREQLLRQLCRALRRAIDLLDVVRVAAVALAGPSARIAQ